MQNLITWTVQRIDARILTGAHMASETPSYTETHNSPMLPLTSCNTSRSETWMQCTLLRVSGARVNQDLHKADRLTGEFLLNNQWYEETVLNMSHIISPLHDWCNHKHTYSESMLSEATVLRGSNRQRQSVATKSPQPPPNSSLERQQQGKWGWL